MRKCAILRLDAIGDFVLWLDAAEALISYELNKEAEVFLFCKPVNALIAEKYLTVYKSITVVPISSSLREIDSYLNIKFDVLYQCSFNNTQFIDSIAKAFNCDNKFSMRKSGNIYSEIVICENEWQHEYLKNIRFTEYIIGESIEIPIHNRKKDKGGYITFSPFASMYQRSLDPVKCEQLIEYCLENTELKCYLLGEQVEKVKIDEMINHIKSNRCINMAGKTTVLEYTDIIESSSLVIGNDSSCIHIAAYCGVPSFCICGGQHWGKFIPYDESLNDYFILPYYVDHYMGCFKCDFNRKKKSFRCLTSKFRRKRFPCIDDIDVGELFFELEKCIQSL
ncbi:MAG: hypothetical protein LUG93_14610 [Lachnospiraceae bacterium]|nr:hypothetical protein [Lachnospiraceae bacterium]